MNSQDFRSLQEAYMEVVENQQLDEISLKTKMKAYAASRDVDADYAYGSKVHDQGDRIKKSIVKKHGEKAGEDAERHAEVSNFGRGTPKAKPRIEKNRTYRTTKTGKMHGQDQAKLKKDLQYKRSSRNEEYDLYNIILSHLLDEGYADTEQAAEAIMVNMSEDWRQSICEEKYKTYVVDIDPKEVEKVYQRKMQAERERKFAKRMAKQSVKDSTREN
jgi:hypothetical protein